MFIRLLALFTIVPIVELYVLLEVGAVIGVGWTVLLILLTGVAGAYLARIQGFDLLRRMQTELEQGRLPAEELLDGAMILVGGVLLLTPGFCTDILGFSLLIPISRGFFKQSARKWLERMRNNGQIHIRRF